MTQGLNRRKSLLLLAGALLPATAYASPKPSYPTLKRGVSFHHLLNWPDTRNTGSSISYVWPPFRSADRRIDPEKLSFLRKVGFDFIRLTVDPSIMIVDNAPDQWDFLKAHFKDVVTTLIQAGFVVIFDLHPVGVNPNYGPDKLIKGVTSPEFTAYAELVERVAFALKDFPAKSIIFELMNEPGINQLANASVWQPMLEALHARARAAAPNLTLLLTGVEWSDYRSLDKLNIKPFEDSNVMYTFHYYEPHIFTHQGTDLHYVTQYMSDVHWPQTDAGIAEIITRSKARIDARPDMDPGTKKAQLDIIVRRLRELMNGRYDAGRIRTDFKVVADWADRNAISRDRIVLGEFGCSMSSNGQPVGPDRVNWIRTIRQTAESFGFPWCYWAYKSNNASMEFVSARGDIHEELIEPLGLNAV